MSDQITDIRDGQFDPLLRQASKPIIVDFWAPWCGPCKAMAPAFAALADSYADQLIFAKCNVDENTGLANRFGIKAIPTVLIFKAGEVVHSMTGMVASRTLDEAIQKVLAGESMPAPFVVT